MGAGFLYCPPAIRTYAEMFWDPLLLEYFNHADVGIVTCSQPAIASVVQGRRRGYEVLQALCSLVSPLYDAYGPQYTEPKQRPNQTVHEYVTSWTTYVQCALMGRDLYSQRGFICGMIRGLQPHFHTMFGRDLHRHVEQLPWDRPLPPEYAPSNLVRAISSLLQLPPTSAILVTKTAQDFLAPAYSIRSLRSPELRDILCHVCSTTHSNAEDGCPVRRNIASNVTAQRLVTGWLHNSGTREGGAALVHQVEDMTAELGLLVDEAVATVGPSGLNFKVAGMMFV
jgi:hypothetical protein